MVRAVGRRCRRAAEKGHEAVVQALLARHDIEADSEDMNGRTLWWSVANGYEAVVKLLFAKNIVHRKSWQACGLIRGNQAQVLGELVLADPPQR